MQDFDAFDLYLKAQLDLDHRTSEFVLCMSLPQ